MATHACRRTDLLINSETLVLKLLETLVLKGAEAVGEIVDAEDDDDEVEDSEGDEEDVLSDEDDDDCSSEDENGPEDVEVGRGKT